VKIGVLAVCVPIGRRTELFWDQPIAIAARKDEIFARSRIMFDARKVTSRHNPVALFMLGGISAKCRADVMFDAIGRCERAKKLRADPVDQPPI